MTTYRAVATHTDTGSTWERSGMPSAENAAVQLVTYMTMHGWSGDKTSVIATLVAGQTITYRRRTYRVEKV